MKLKSYIRTPEIREKNRQGSIGNVRAGYNREYWKVIYLRKIEESKQCAHF